MLHEEMYSWAQIAKSTPLAKADMHQKEKSRVFLHQAIAQSCREMHFMAECLRSN